MVAGDQRASTLLEGSQVVQGGAGVGQQGFTEGGQRHPATRSVEQPPTQVGLQPPDGVAEAGLPPVQTFGGATEVELFGDRDECFQF
jgi:hypothetical protein